MAKSFFASRRSLLVLALAAPGLWGGSAARVVGPARKKGCAPFFPGS